MSDGLITAQNLDKTYGESQPIPNLASPQMKATAHPCATTASACNLASLKCSKSYFAKIFLDPGSTIKKVGSTRQACQGEKAREAQLDAVLPSKQSKIFPNLEVDFDSPTDLYVSRTKNKIEKVYSKKRVNPCQCFIAELAKNLTIYSDSSLFRTIHIDDPTRAKKIQLNDTVSELCGQYNWYQLCGPLTFTVKDRHLRPFGGLAWAEHQSTHIRGRRLQAVAPSTPDPPTTAILVDNVVINWTVPGVGSPIMGYKVFIKAKNGVFFQYTSFTGTAITCTVPFSVLQNSPYLLDGGVSVEAKVQAINSKGSSAQSMPGNGAVLPMVPNTPAAPITAILGSDVTITWAAPADGGSPITGYNVLIRQSDGFTSSFSGCTSTAVNCIVPISVLKDAPFNLTAGSSVFASVKATNAIGSSPYSTDSNGAVLTAPSTPAAPITAILGSDVTITWAAPADGGSPITGYNVLIRQSDGFTSSFSGCTSSAVSCIVPISVLKDAPFNLTAGSSVFASVKATNAIGSSPYSTDSNGAVLTAPSTPAAPVISILGNDVTITWSAPADGGSPITGYIVLIRQSDGVSFSALASCTGTSVTCIISNTVLQASPYNLASRASIYAQVKAINLIGTSAASPAGNGAPTVPNIPAAPTTTISGSNVEIQWVAPAQGSTSITGYTVLIRQSDAVTFTTYLGCTGTSVSCQVPIRVLKASIYNLAVGASIYASVFATNDIGSSSVSAPGNGAVIPASPKARLFFITSQTLNAVIGQQTSLLLPIITDVSYQLLSRPQYQVLLDGNLLKVRSNSVSDIGSHKLRIMASDSSKSSNFTVNVIFNDLNSNVLQSQNYTDEIKKVQDTATTKQKSSGSEPKQPKLTILKANTKGLLVFKFSEPVGLEALIIPKLVPEKRRLKTKNDGSTQSKASIEKAYDSDPTYLNLLTDKHLNVTIKSQNATVPVVTWYAFNITSTQIMVQVVFQHPLYISTDPGVLDKIIISILPPLQIYMRSLASGAITENALTTVTYKLPPQVILGTAIDSTETATDYLKMLGQYSTIAYVFVQIVLSQSMALMWSMVNAQQIIMTYQLLNQQMPGNVILVITKLSDISSFTLFPVDDFFAWLFYFSPTDAPGVGFECMGVENASVTLYLGMAFLMMMLMGLKYLLYGLAFRCRLYDKIMSQIEEYFKPGLFYGLIYVFLVETYLDWAIGSALRLEQPNFDTPSDHFDLILADVGIVITLVFPFYCFFFLKKNLKQLANEVFKSKHGALYDGFTTVTADRRLASMKMSAWFVIRRLFTAINVVYIRHFTIWIQLTFNMLLSLIDICVKINLSPYESKLGGFMEKFNDVLVLICAYFLYLFTDLIPSPEDKYYIGWFYDGIIGTIIVANLGVMLTTVFRDVRQKIKEIIFNYRTKKQTKARIANREQQQKMLKLLQPAAIDGFVEVKPRLTLFKNGSNKIQQLSLEQLVETERDARKQRRAASLARKRVREMDDELAKIREVDEIQEIELSDRSVQRNHLQKNNFPQRNSLKAQIREDKLLQAGKQFDKEEVKEHQQQVFMFERRQRLFDEKLLDRKKLVRQQEELKQQAWDLETAQWKQSLEQNASEIKKRMLDEVQQKEVTSKQQEQKMLAEIRWQIEEEFKEDLKNYNLKEEQRRKVSYSKHLETYRL